MKIKITILLIMIIGLSLMGKNLSVNNDSYSATYYHGYLKTAGIYNVNINNSEIMRGNYGFLFRMVNGKRLLAKEQNAQTYTFENNKCIYTKTFIDADGTKVMDVKREAEFLKDSIKVKVTVTPAVEIIPQKNGVWLNDDLLFNVSALNDGTLSGLTLKDEKDISSSIPVPFDNKVWKFTSQILSSCTLDANFGKVSIKGSENVGFQPSYYINSKYVTIKVLPDLSRLPKNIGKEYVYDYSITFEK